jgi:hypothetical protein
MQYADPKQHEKDGEIACVRTILEQKEAINLDLFELAKELRDECHEAIRQHDLKHYRKPPCTLTVKAEPKKVGPKIIWITYTTKKITIKSGKSVRFTDEVRGRKNGRNPKRIFNSYDDDLKAMLIDIEHRAAELRQRSFFWRAAIKQAELIVSEAGA